MNETEKRILDGVSRTSLDIRDYEGRKSKDEDEDEDEDD